MPTQTESGYNVILSLIHAYTLTTNSPSVDGFTLFILRRQAMELQNQREIIKEKILQEADKYIQNKEVKK